MTDQTQQTDEDLDAAANAPTDGTTNTPDAGAQPTDGSLLRQERDRAAEKARTFAFQLAGVDLNTDGGKRIAELYRGDADPDQIRSFVSELQSALGGGQSNDQAGQAQAGDPQADARAAAVGTLNQLRGASTVAPGKPSLLEAQATADAAGDLDGALEGAVQFARQYSETNSVV